MGRGARSSGGVAGPRPPVTASRELDRRALGRGVLVGLGVIVVLSALQAGARRALPELATGAVGPVGFLVGILGAFFLAGRVAALRAGRARGVHAALAAGGALAAWLLLRTVRNLVTGQGVGLDLPVVAAACVGALLLGTLGGVVRPRSGSSSA